MPMLFISRLIGIDKKKLQYTNKVLQYKIKKFNKMILILSGNAVIMKSCGIDLVM